MKKLFTVAAILVLAIQTWAVNFTDPLSRVVHKQQAQAAGPLEKLLQAAACLHEGQAKCTSLNWNQATQHIQQADQRANQRLALLNQHQALQIQATLVPDALAPYSEILKTRVFEQAARNKFIFIGESHLAGISPTVSQALGIIRAQKPHARILLASEFMITGAPLQAVPLQVSGTRNPHFLQPVPSYQAVFQTAAQLKMDILSLDDMWIDPAILQNNSARWSFPVKVGNYLVQGTLQTPQLKEFIRYAGGSTIENNPLQIAALLRHFFLSSAWGLEQRNKQWTNYLAALQDAYDVIIVYGGSAHMNPTSSMPPIPQLLGLKDYACILLDKVPTPQEQAEIDRISRQYNHQASKALLATKPGILYRQLSLSADKPTPAQSAIHAQLQTTEKALGFTGVEPYWVQITLPQ